METKNANGLTFLGLFGVGLGWLALTLTILGLFYIWLIIILAVGAGSLLVYFFIKSKEKISFNKEFWGVALLSLLAIFLFSYYSVPTVFSGRDQGSFSGASILLAQNHHIQASFKAEKEFFKIYGRGTALNFPGFNYNKAGALVPHFPLGYIAWLATFYALFGLAGFILANGVTFFLFLLSFYFLSRLYAKQAPSLVVLFLTFTSFVFSWFFKFTLSENLALALIWFGIFQLALFLKNQKTLHFWAFFFTFGLLAFVRLEVFAFGLIALIILWRWPQIGKVFQEKVWRKKIGGACLLILILFLLSLRINSSFYITFAKGFLNAFHFKNTLVGHTYPFKNMLYVFHIFNAYGLTEYLIIGFIGFLYFLKNKKKYLIIPYLILLPSFIYLINPSISLDYPWMLRRYVFAVIPLSLLYTVLFLNSLFKKRRIYFYCLSFLLLLTNLIVFLPYLKVKENKGLLPPTKKISVLFKKNDLVLVDREATGNPWAMMAGPLNWLYGKQAVYFFNPLDIKKIDLTKFDKTYLIIPDNRIEFYRKNGFGPKLLPYHQYILKSSALDITAQTEKTKEEIYKNPIKLPSYQKKYIYGKVYLWLK